MTIWKFSSLEVAIQEDERVTKVMNLPSEMNAFNVHEDELNGVFTFADAEIERVIDFNLITIKEYVR